MAILIILVAGALATFGIVRIAAPGTTGFEPASVERDDGIVQLASSGFLASACIGIEGIDGSIGTMSRGT